MSCKDMYDEMGRSLSDADLKRELPDTRIINYSDLTQYSTIQQLLPRRVDAVIILVELKQDIGHWICVLRHGKSIVFFDPYGVRPDKELSWVSKYMRKQLGQEEPHMSVLLNKAIDSGFKVSFNSVRYQQESPAVNTCGRHAISVIKFFRNSFKPTLAKYKKYMSKLSKDNHLMYDLLVTKMTA